MIILLLITMWITTALAFTAGFIVCKIKMSVELSKAFEARLSSIIKPKSPLGAVQRPTAEKLEEIGSPIVKETKEEMAKLLDDIGIERK